jgi:hypothetical protein
MPATMTFAPIGQGWADCELRLGERAFTLTGISYLTEALGDLARLALMIATGAYRATVSFDREPAEWRIVAIALTDAAGGGPVSINVYSFPDMSDAPLSEGTLEFTADCGADEFARAVLDGIRAALADPRLRGFTEPTGALRVLELALT